MVTRAEIDDFLSQNKLAVVGVSRKKSKFGRMVYNDLAKKGYNVFPVNPNMDKINGQPCYPALKAIPQPLDGAVIIVPPAQTGNVVREAVELKIPRVWIQQGAESSTALQFCKENGITAIHGECILMFAEPVGLLHRVHRFVWKLLGKLPR